MNAKEECGQFTGRSQDGSEYHCKKTKGHSGSCNPLHGMKFPLTDHAIDKTVAAIAMKQGCWKLPDSDLIEFGRLVYREAVERLRTAREE